MSIKSYSKQDLFDMWFRFKDNPDADTILSDFMGSDKQAARELIREFEVIVESHYLGYAFRGKEDRVKHTI